MARPNPPSTADEPAQVRLPFGGENIDLEDTLNRREKLRIVIDRTLATPLRIIWDDRRARFGAFTTIVYLLMGTIGVVITEAPFVGQASENVAWLLAPERFSRVLAAPLNPAVWQHPLGTNHLGMDELALMIHATPAMFQMMFAGAVVSVFIAVTFATVAGYKGGVVDTVLMTITDTVLGIPGLPLVIILTATIAPESPFVVGLILGIDNWPGLTRTLRSQVLTLRDEPYVEASRVMGLPLSDVLRKDIVPELLPYTFINFIRALVAIIGQSVALYFLGILPFSHLNWGVALNQAYQRGLGIYGFNQIHQLLVPIITITLLSFGLTLLAQSLDKVFNPRVRARHADTVADDLAEEGSS
jgi:peptide/nickel transport system permease protein